MRLWLVLPLLSVAVADARAQSLQIDASFPRALHQWNTTGFSADVGAIIASQNFVGLEWTYFNPKVTVTIPVAGRVNSSQTFNLAQLVYRYSLPIDFFGRSGGAALVELYAGVGGGLGLVRQSVSYVSAIPGINGASAGAESQAEVCYEGVAGLQINLTSNFGVRFGFRYIDSVNNVRLFNTDANTDTKTLEAGVACRF